MIVRRWLKKIRPASLIWYYSCVAYRRKLYPIAWFLKFLNFALFRSLLCFECEIESDIEIVHFGIGCVTHPNVKIGHRVKMYHQVTLASETYIGSPSKITIEDDVLLGAHCIIIGNNRGGTTIGRGAKIGAGAIVVGDVPAGATVVGPRATIL